MYQLYEEPRNALCDASGTPSESAACDLPCTEPDTASSGALCDASADASHSAPDDASHSAPDDA